MANRRGLTVSQTSGRAEIPNYSNLISCWAYWEGGSRFIAGSLFQADEPRIVQVDDYRVDVRPAGRILITYSHDEPGVIGTVGSILGEAEVNIASMRLGRDKPGGRAMSFIRVDSEVLDPVINKLLTYKPVVKVKMVDLR